EGALDVSAGRPGSVEKQLVIVRPDLHVPGHGLAVEPHVVGCSAEQDVQEFIVAPFQLELVFVAMNPSPAMGPPVSVAHGPVMFARLWLARPRFMKPTRLRDA